MKKQLHPYPNLDILIQSNGSTYNDSIYSINMWKNINKDKMKSNNIFFSGELKFNKENLLWNIKRSHKKKIINLILNNKFFFNKNIHFKKNLLNTQVINNNLSLELLCAFTKYKIIFFHKQNLINYSNLSLFTINKIKPLDVDVLTNPLWNGKDESRFGMSGQTSDNALFKFKKRFSSF